jgi:hypothetical protein
LVAGDHGHSVIVLEWSLKAHHFVSSSSRHDFGITKF